MISKVISALNILASGTMPLGKNKHEKNESFFESLILNDGSEMNRIKTHSSEATIIKQEFTTFNDGGYRF